MHRKLCLIVVLLVTPLRAQEVSVATKSQPIGPVPLERLARRIEPDLVGQPQRVPQYLDFFRRELVNDPRHLAFDVTAKAMPKSGVELRGYIEFAETHKAIVSFFTALGFDVEDQLESLPSESLGEQRFGLVKTSHSLSYDRPSGRRGVVTDCLLGEPLYLLREDNGHFLVHSGEGYLGYVSAADVHRVDEAAFAEYLEGPRVRVSEDYEVTSELVIPAGARLQWLSASLQNVTVGLPTGELINGIPPAACEIISEPRDEIDAIVKNAKRLIGTPYHWGGKTSKGVDCSGLVQIGYATVGLNLPRDSNQQYLLGRLTATRWHRAGMRRGDTLYFLGSDGKIRHTALYLGDDQFLQAVVPKVVVSSFNPKHDNYDEDHYKSFAFAKRLLE